MKISYQFLVDKFLNRNNISLYIFSKPRYNKSILLNVDNSKDICIKKKKFKFEIIENFMMAVAESFGVQGPEQVTYL